MSKRTFLILPGCDDTNRGDQALIWETVSLAKDSGFQGEFFMIADQEKSQQSVAEGIGNIEYILKHPSTHFKQKNNIRYGVLLKLKWAIVSIVDSLKALLLLSPFIRKHCIKLYSRCTQRTIQVFEKSETAFVKGGGFLHAYGNPIETYTAFYNLYHIILAQSMGIPVYVMPNSYGPFDSIGSGPLIKRVLKKCKFVSAREKISQDSIRKLGIECKLYPDLAFYLKANSTLNSRQMERLNKILSSGKRCVAITMRPYRFPDLNNSAEAYKLYQESMCDFVRFLSEYGFLPVLIEHTYSDTEHERDMSCINDVVELLGNSCEYEVYSDLSLDSRQLKYIYSRFDYIVGTRFHSVIFSLASQVPAIAITYGGNKGEGIMDDIGLSEYAISINDLTIESLINKFTQLVKNEVQVKDKIKNYLSNLSEMRIQLIDEIRGLKK